MRGEKPNCNVEIFFPTDLQRDVKISDHASENVCNRVTCDVLSWLGICEKKDLILIKLEVK